MTMRIIEVVGVHSYKKVPLNVHKIFSYIDLVFLFFTSNALYFVAIVVTLLFDAFYQQCVSLVLSLISSSLDAWRTRQYDYYQRVLNGIL